MAGGRCEGDVHLMTLLVLGVLVTDCLITRGLDTGGVGLTGLPGLSHLPGLTVLPGCCGAVVGGKSLTNLQAPAVLTDLPRHLEPRTS